MEKTPLDGGPGAFDGGENEHDRILELLAHPYRRFVLRYLADADGPWTVDEVATDLGAWQAELPPEDRRATGIDGIESALHHRDLPKMDAANLVEYDPVRRTVAPTARTPTTTGSLDEFRGE